VLFFVVSNVSILFGLHDPEGITEGSRQEDRRMVFDSNRAILKNPDTFKRFNVTSKAIPLKEAKLNPNEVLLVFERCGERRALLQKQMVYHHLAQGELAGEPYLVSF
jgi:hypothetical protein